jgi:hypothetical protein
VCVFLQTSVGQLQRRSPESLAMFVLLALLPGGVLEADVEAIWGDGLTFGRLAFRDSSGSLSPVPDSSKLDLADTLSVCSMESRGTRATFTSVASSHLSGLGGFTGLAARASCAWKDLLTPLLNAGLVERSQKLLPQGTDSLFVRWLGITEGWDVAGVLDVAAASPASVSQLTAASGSGRRVAPAGVFHATSVHLGDTSCPRDCSLLREWDLFQLHVCACGTRIHECYFRVVTLHSSGGCRLLWLLSHSALCCFAGFLLPWSDPFVSAFATLFRFAW